MARKSGVGKLPSNDDFKPKKIQKFDSNRQSNRVSFKVPKPKDDLRNLDDKCGFNEINDSQNLLEKRGRKTGEIYLPDPIEVTNYNSQALRYDRSLDLEIDRIYQDTNGRTVYAFCSKNSPTGFWEVTSVSGTFLDIPNPNLVIICPRPFTASELLGTITSDGTTFRWSQLQGRTTIISPTQGDVASGVLNPMFSTIGAPSTFDPPILLLLELLDNPLIFRIVQIVTTPTSDNFGKDLSMAIADIAPEFKVLSIVPSPSRISGASVYLGEQLNFTWNLPTNNNLLINFSVLQNVSGSYDLLSDVNISDRQFVFSANSYYQIQANYADEYDAFQSRSDTFYWQFPLEFAGRIFADETINSKALAIANNPGYTDYQLQVLYYTLDDQLGSKSVAIANNPSYIEYQLQVLYYTLDEQIGSKGVAIANDPSYVNYQLGGIIIG